MFLKIQLLFGFQSIGRISNVIHRPECLDSTNLPGLCLQFVLHGSVVQTCTVKLPDFRLQCLLMLIFFQGCTNVHTNAHDVIEKTI